MTLDDLEGGLVVSCQPVPGGPMDHAEMIVGFALAARNAGARGLRIESVANVDAVRKATDAPIIGIVKRDLDASPVRITPWLLDVEALCDAGADIVAFDSTARERPVPVAGLIAAIKRHGRLAMADCASIEDARVALAAGADCVGTTLSGYTGGAIPQDPDLALIGQMRALTPYVMAEGRLRTPVQAAAARAAGAFAVVVGSAITRTEHATAWFRAAIENAPAPASAEPRTVLAIDIGGTKIQAALVTDARIEDQIRIATDRAADPDRWLSAIVEKCGRWTDRYARVGVAVSGIVENGSWSALSRETLDFPGEYPLCGRLQALTGKPVTASNDAQAAAWGEFRARFDEGDLVFLTVSTGLGGGIVANGSLLGKRAGHFGLTGGFAGRSPHLEDQVSGRWIEAEALRSGHPLEAPAVFAAAANGRTWANAIIDASAARLAALCHDICLMLDPERIVIGGGIGLAATYLDRVRARLHAVSPDFATRLEAARLGQMAGILGVADLASRR